VKNKPQVSGKLCAYCGIAPAVELEHVIARCIIPPPRKDMITVPACGKCNDDKKHDDEQLRDMLIMDIENDGHPLIDDREKGRLIRAIGRGQSGFVRQARGKSIYEERRTVGGISLGYANRAYTDPERINKIFSWIVRGLLFKETGERLPADCVIKAGKIYLGHHEAAIADLKAKGGRNSLAISPAFGSFVLRAAPNVSRWILRFFNVYAWVTTMEKDNAPKVPR